METLDQIFCRGVKHHQDGKLSQAESAYREILNREPDHVDALHLLGLIAHQKGQHDIAVEIMQKAITLRPDWPEANYNIGIALFAGGQVDHAIAAFGRAILLDPQLADAHNSLGNALRAKGEFVAALGAFERAIALKPGYADAHNNLGNVLRDLEQPDRAIAAYRRAISLRPSYPQALNNLAVTLQTHGQVDQAIAAYRQAIALKPDYAEAHNNFGIALRENGQLAQAVAAHEHALALRPDWGQAHNSLGNALIDQGQLDQGLAAYERAVLLSPAFADAHYNLGKTLIDVGEVDRAITAFRHALALQPDNSAFNSALLFALYYQATATPESIAGEHFRWGRQHTDLAGKSIEFSPRKNRRLRIGYVSPDFRHHPVGRYLLPIIEHHDHQEFEILCYSDAGQADAVTARFQSLTDHWRDTKTQTHDQLAAHIREDEIDILVDLTGHTTGSRLMMFARKPAPIQVAYLGYPGTTGLAAIDHRLTDSLADPPGMTEQFHSETLYRLPNTAWCYSEQEPSPAIAPAPLHQNGYVTFGSFNNFAKVSDAMLQIWADILLTIPDSRLLLKATSFASKIASERAVRAFTQKGININRLILIGPQPDHNTHLATYNRVDIALDTFPYHGTTTTCDALWMGVPVITLAGPSHLSRNGVSLLTTIGLPDLIANTSDQYIQLAMMMAHNSDRLDDLRLTLRDRMKQSPLMDGIAATRGIEAAYRSFSRR